MDDKTKEGIVYIKELYENIPVYPIDEGYAVLAVYIAEGLTNLAERIKVVLGYEEFMNDYRSSVIEAATLYLEDETNSDAMNLLEQLSIKSIEYMQVSMAYVKEVKELDVILKEHYPIPETTNGNVINFPGNKTIH